MTGTIFDASNHQPVCGAVIVTIESGHVTHSDSTGFFRFDHLAPGRTSLAIRHVAFQSMQKAVVCPEAGTSHIVIELQPAAFETDEVIVRSTRTSGRNGETSFPSEIITPSELQQHSAVSVPDVIRSSPGISLVRDGAWETDISIRGMSGSKIVTMIDNTRIETATDIAGALSLFQMHDLEQVDVLKSSGSVLFGTGTFGGVVHMISKRPAFSDATCTHGELSNEYSSVDGKTTEFGAIERNSGTYALRLSGGYRKAKNTMTPVGEIPHSQYHDFSLNGSLGIKTFPNHSLFLSYQRSQAEDTGIPGGAPFAATASARYTLANRELMGVEYTIPNVRPNVPLITLRASHQSIDRRVEIIQSPVVTLTPHAVHVTNSGQLESKISFSSNQLLTVGVDVWQRSLESKRERTNPVTGQVTGDRPIPASRFFSGGLFAEDEWQIYPGTLSLSFGGRYDWIRINNDETLTPEYTITSGTMNVTPAGQHILWHEASANNGSWSAHAGFSFTINPEIQFTSLISTAFRAPSLEERFQYLNLGSVVRVGNPNLRPEQSISINTGLRVHTGAVGLRADVFYNHLTDLVSYVPGVFEGLNAFIQDNIGDARLYGYELSAEYSPVRWNALSASISYVRGEDTFGKTNLPMIAPLTGRASSKNSVGGVGSITVAATFVAEQRNLAAAELLTPGYTLFDADIATNAIALGSISFIVRSGMQNIFDRLYQNHLSTLRGIVTFEPGRNFFISTTITL